MTDATQSPAPRTRKSAPAADETIVEAEVIESPDAASADAGKVETVEVVESTSAPTAPPAQVIYVQTPAPPVRKGNRGIGALIALVSAIIFTGALAVVAAIIQLAVGARPLFGFLTSPQFYIPTLFFVIAFVLLVLVANRAAWWAYILGSVIVALVVYFGSIGALLLANGVILMTPAEAADGFRAGLVNPIIIAAALLAREVSLWTGSIIARRGRRVKERNATARASWEREVAEKRAEYERSAAGGATAV